jgi:beta-lactamase superfamily II metal-dependent hydrolase
MTQLFFRCAAMLALILIPFRAAGSAADRKLDIYWVDVEGGAATLIVTPSGESILVDAGNPGGRDPARIHKVAAEVAGLKKIDHLLVTHFHTDHFGGAAEVSQLIPIGQANDNGIPDQNPDNNPRDTRFPLLIKPYREMSVEKRNVLKPGDLIPLKQLTGGPGLSFRCVAAKQQFAATRSAVANPECAAGTAKDKDTSDNANSIVSLLEFGEFRFFIGGDLTWNVEAQLVCPVNRIGVVDVYQVNHHGLDVSNNPVLVRSLAPTVSVMSNGTSKGCGAASFATLKGIPSLEAMYQIHRNLRPDSQNNTSDEFIANLEKDCQAHYIKLSVDASARTYTVSIPGRGHERTFQTRLKSR